MREAYTWSKTSGKEKVGLFAGKLIGARGEKYVTIFHSVFTVVALFLLLAEGFRAVCITLQEQEGIFLRNVHL